MTIDDQSTPPMTRLAQAGLLACGLFTTIGLFSPGLILPQIEQAFASTAHAGLLTQLIGAIASFSFAVGAPFAGTLIARLGCRRVIVVSLIVFALAGTAPVVLNNLWFILATRVILGLALSGVFTGGLAGIGALPGERRASMFGWFSVVGGAAAIVVFPAVGALGRYGWHLPFLVHLAAFAVLPLAVRVPETLGLVERSSAALLSEGSPGLYGPVMIGLFGMAALVGMSMFLGPMYSPLYLTSLGVTDTRLLAIPVTLGSIAAVFASGAYGTMHRRLGVNGVSAVTMIGMGSMLLLAGIAPTIPLFTTAIVLFSAGVATMAPNLSAAAMAFSPPARGAQAIGLVNGMMFGAQLLFPFIAAWLRAATGISGVFLAFGACVLLVGLLIGAKLKLARAAPTTG